MTWEDVEATALALTAVEESDGDPAKALAALGEELDALDPDEQAMAERAMRIIRERS